MRDRVLTYAFAISVGLHLILLGFVGRTSAARPIDLDELKIVRVEMVDLSAESKPAPPEAAKPSVKPEPAHISIIPPKSAPPVKPKQPEKTAKPKSPIRSPIYSSKPGQSASNRLPGNPGGPLDLGTPSRNGVDVGPSGRTPVGSVPGSPGGTGAGPGKGPGTAPPEPVPGAMEGPGRTASPPPPPPPPDVEVKICAESKMLPGPNCERTVVRTFRPGTQPTSRCTVCKPPHLNAFAPPKPPELISGRKSPKYPASARDRGIEGTVTVEYTINTDGKVVGVKVVSSSGSDDLDRAAIETVESRKYKPAMQAGKPRNYRKRETFSFRLN